MAKTKKKVAFLGPAGSFSHEAAQATFPAKSYELVQEHTLEDVFDSVYSEKVDYALMPVENSTDGIIAVTYHKLVEQGDDPPVKIWGEVYHPIALHLGAALPVSLDSIDYVHTKKEPWDQCRAWVARNLSKSVTFISESSTSQGARAVFEEAAPNRATIASNLAMELYDLNILAKGIEDFRTNQTRFLVVGKKRWSRRRKGGDDKMTLAMVLHDQVGALAKTFGRLAECGVDVRTVKVSPVRAPGILEWKDWFFIDVVCREGDTRHVEKALIQLRGTEGLVIIVRPLGQYPRKDGTDDGRPRSEPPAGPADIDSPGGMSFDSIIAAGEGTTIEFKSTLRWDLKENRKSSDVEFGVIKTIAGFMNARGGILVIGADDDGGVIGLAKDYSTLHKQSRDGLELHVSNLVQRSFGAALAHLVEVRFTEKDDKEVCIVVVQPSPRPIFLQREGKTEFYVRTGNQTRPFDSRETAEYVRYRWD